MSRSLNKLVANRWVKLLITIVIVAYMAYEKLNNSGGSGSQRATLPNGSSGAVLDKNLILTKHAKCRMGCRNISLDEVKFVRDNGQINQRKSDPTSQPCPTESREARSSDGQLIRVVFAACPQKTKVITVIDLENKYQCSCR